MINHIANIRPVASSLMLGILALTAIRRFSTFPQACLRKLCAGNSGFERKKKKRRDDIVLKLEEKLRDVF